MPDLLLELFSEEIPARMQARAAEDLRRLVTERLVEAGLVYEGAKAFATPRRLALTVQGIPARQPDLREERKGPRVGAPEAAVQGFVKSAGLASISEATVQKDPKKGEFYVALVEKPGRPAIEVLAELLPVIVRTFPWPKSMRWGEGRLAWVRPLHSIIATFGPETEEPDIVPFAVDGITAGNVTRGHRFMAPAPFTVKRFDDYVRKLEAAKAVLDRERRKDIILHDARHLAFAQGLELVEDDGLLDEVAGLVEWPVVLMGGFEQSFLAIPDEVIRSTIRNNQKCFVVKQGDRLAPKFILVANIEATDGGAAIIAGNERVIRARLADAKFFYETDLKTRLEDRLPKFKDIVFHEKLGSQWERIERIEELASELSAVVGADPALVKRAARLCKADLLTEVVGEFPELQGLMGRYYALAQGEDESVARACEEHYKPLGPGDRVPTDPVAVAVALADKIDTLVGFWAIDEKPTGSKDPFALRRSALGVIRIVLENGLRFHLSEVIGNYLLQIRRMRPLRGTSRIAEAALHGRGGASGADNSLLVFFADRLKVQLREQGARHDLVDAVFALREAGSAGGATGTQEQKAGSAGGATGTQEQKAGSAGGAAGTQEQEAGSAEGAAGTQQVQDDLLLVVRRVEALGALLASEDGKNLLAGYKRATNIIRIEEKRDKTSYEAAPDPALYRQAEEWELAQAIDVAKREAGHAVAREDFAAAMSAMAKLRPHVDAFFDRVTVNVEGGAEEKAVRANRLRLLNQIRSATLAVADFSRIEG